MLAPQSVAAPLCFGRRDLHLGRPDPGLTGYGGLAQFGGVVRDIGVTAALCEMFFRLKSGPLVVEHPWTTAQVKAPELVPGKVVQPRERFALQIVSTDPERPIQPATSTTGDKPYLSATLFEAGATHWPELTLWAPHGEPMLYFAGTGGSVRLPSTIVPGKAKIFFQVVTDIAAVSSCPGFTRCSWISKIVTGSFDVVLSQRFAGP